LSSLIKETKIIYHGDNDLKTSNSSQVTEYFTCSTATLVHVLFHITK